MPLNPSQALEFSKELIEWFWKQGIQRKGLYELRPSDWLREVYTANTKLAQVEVSSRNLRPAFALWGPSQTGKSTLLSNFLDERVWGNLGPEDKVDATRSGLYWPGADPCVFFVDLPQDQMHRAEGLISMNPYTGGRDASAVLTRFVRGSLTGGNGTYHVQVPKYPVEIRFLGEKQVLHALAMGYDTECLGRPSKQAWQQREWTQIEFVNELDRFNLEHPVPEGSPVDRAAFEIVQRLCAVLQDLVLAKIRRFEKLALSSRTEDWQSVVHSLLEQRSLLSSTDNAREFAAWVLWDGAPHVTEHYRKLLRMLGQIEERWGERTKFTSLKVATQLLDMDTYDLVERGRKPLPKVCDRIEGERVFLDLDNGQPLISQVEDFGLLQGLVWEIVVPVNLENLSQTPFSRFIERGDLLDFPGVANESTNEVKRINVWDDVPPEQRKTLQPDQDFRPYLFFAKILKRGKTASIVSTYAQRLTIDGFTIFLYLDKHPPVNADQILSGVSTWWNCMAPDYDTKLGGRSPLPLNLALTWWKSLFDDYAALTRRRENFFPTKVEIVKTLGRVSNAGVVWATLALNYYKYSRGRPDADVVAADKLFDWLLADKDALLQFASRPIRAELEGELRKWEAQSPESVRPSFERWVEQSKSRLAADPGLQTIRVMLEDKEKGGSVYLLELFSRQLDELAGGSKLNRGKALEDLKVREAERIERLLKGEFMFPPPEAKDIRRENLQKFMANLERATRDGEGPKARLLPEEKMRLVNRALREFLNVDYSALDILPTFNQSITEAFIQKQYQNWTRKQAAMWRACCEAPNAGQDVPPYWNLLGVTSPVLAEVYLTSLSDSITLKQRDEIARWLREEVRVGQQNGVRTVRQHDHRPFLAVQMSNALVGNHEAEYDEEKPPSFTVLIEPFLRRQLPELMKAPGSFAKVDAPGDKELRELCKRYQIEIETPAQVANP